MSHHRHQHPGFETRSSRFLSDSESVREVGVAVPTTMWLQVQRRIEGQVSRGLVLCVLRSFVTSCFALGVTAMEM